MHLNLGSDLYVYKEYIRQVHPYVLSVLSPSIRHKHVSDNGIVVVADTVLAAAGQRTICRLDSSLVSTIMIAW
jgi:hypothetical protein